MSEDTVTLYSQTVKLGRRRRCPVPCLLSAQRCTECRRGFDVTGRGLPLYRRTADEILAMIASGKLGLEFTVPEIAKQAGVKDWAARKAAEHLAERGLIEPHQGSGYRTLITPEEAAATRLDERPVRDQVAALQQEVAELRRQVAALSDNAELAKRVGRIEANLIALYGQLQREYPRGGRRERAKAAAGGGQR